MSAVLSIIGQDICFSSYFWGRGGGLCFEMRNAPVEKCLNLRDKLLDRLTRFFIMLSIERWAGWFLGVRDGQRLQQKRRAKIALSLVP